MYYTRYRELLVALISKESYFLTVVIHVCNFGRRLKVNIITLELEQVVHARMPIFVRITNQLRNFSTSSQVEAISNRYSHIHHVVAIK